MGNPKARIHKMEQEVAEAWRRTRTQTREISETPHIPGIGHLRAQVVYAPSFEAKYAWDILSGAQGTLHLYRSHVVYQELRYKLRGYHEVAVEEDIPRKFLERSYSLSLPIRPDLSGLGGLDGTHFEIALKGDLSSEVRFRWWCEGPDYWSELTTLASEMIRVFLPLPLCEPQVTE